MWQFNVQYTLDWLAGQIVPLAHTQCSNLLVDSLYDNR